MCVSCFMCCVSVSVSVCIRVYGRYVDTLYKIVCVSMSVSVMMYMNVMNMNMNINSNCIHLQ